GRRVGHLAFLERFEETALAPGAFFPLARPVDAARLGHVHAPLFAANPTCSHCGYSEKVWCPLGRRGCVISIRSRYSTNPRAARKDRGVLLGHHAGACFPLNSVHGRNWLAAILAPAELSARTRTDLLTPADKCDPPANNEL